MTDTNEQQGNYYIIADHLRTTIFALADGAIFEPKGRGYILKKMIKKAVLLAHLLHINETGLQKISEELIAINSSHYSHLKEKESLIISELKKEIEKNVKFISKVTQELNNYYSPEVTAEDIFFWYDTKGIPLELIRSHLATNYHDFPEKEFEELLEEQKNKGLEDRNKKKVTVF